MRSKFIINIYSFLNKMFHNLSFLIVFVNHKFLFQNAINSFCNCIFIRVRIFDIVRRHRTVTVNVEVAKRLAVARSSGCRGTLSQASEPSNRSRGDVRRR